MGAMLMSRQQHEHAERRREVNLVMTNFDSSGVGWVLTQL